MRLKVDRIVSRGHVVFGAGCSCDCDKECDKWLSFRGLSDPVIIKVAVQVIV